jgi:hypothetical protein
MNWVLRHMFNIHDSLVLPAALSLISALVYVVTEIPEFGLLGMTSLIVYNLSVLIIFFKFYMQYSASNLVTTQEIVGEKLLITTANLVGIIILVTLEL